MSEPKHILVVDEQRATLDFLRSVLSLVEDDIFEILRVPSAEEGLLELRRRPYDLMFAGFRLPGMDGLDLTRRARRLRPEMPIILASARPLPELRQQAAALGVSHFLPKPLDAEEFLAAVQESLSNAPPLSASPTLETPEIGEAKLPAAVAERLETLCAETGAGQVLLVTVGGELLYAQGSQLHADLPRLVAASAASVSCSLYLSDQLEEEEPRAVQFLEGDTFDLYWANIGRSHFIVILFDAQVRRGRIGTVWIFTQRAIAEIKSLLAEWPSAAGQGNAALIETPGDQRPDVVEAESEAAQEPAPELSPAVQNEPPPAEVVAAGQENGDREQGVDLDAYWDDALANESGGDFYTTGISLEEAREKGLVDDDFAAGTA